MKTINLSVPDAAERIMQRLTPEEKEKLSAFVQFWLKSFAEKEKPAAFEVMKKIQEEIAAKNLSDTEIQALINESMT